MPQAIPALAIVQDCYEAFGRGDLPAILERVADEVDWKFCGPKRLPYSRQCRTREEVAQWFASVPAVDDILAFEPREFIAADEHLTVLGWERTSAKPNGRVFETEWVHVFTVRGGRIVRFWGMYDNEASLAARS